MTYTTFIATTVASIASDSSIATSETFSDNVTFIIAIIGCITGICSLLLNFYKILYERPKLKIELLSPYLNGFFPNTQATFKSSKILIVSLRFINVGIVPISIKAITIKRDGIFQWASDGYKISELRFKIDDSSSTCYKLRPQKTIPFIISSGEIIESCFVFPFADNIYQTLEGNWKTNLEINVSTSSAKLKIPLYAIDLTLENIKKYIDEHRNELNDLY